MKLYTEKQIISVFEKYGTMSAINARNILDLIKPIELPSDEEIEKQSLLAEDNDLSPVEEWERGAKWLKEQITKTK